MPRRRWSGWPGAAVLVVAVVLVYVPALSYPFQFDDAGSILSNESLRDLWSCHWLKPPATAGETVSGRPLLNFSFAVNYALGGLAVEGYRATNLVIHVLAALALLGVVSRVLVVLSPDWRGAEREAGNRRLLATGLALLWALHPLQTGAVTYVVQRAESLAGLFYLLTLYLFFRGADEAVSSACGAGRGTGRRWLGLAALASLAGVATKEIVVTAPVLILLCDRALYSGSFVAAWRRRRAFYLALASSWLLLALLVAKNSGRGGSAGFAAEIGSVAYLLTQCRAIPHYVSLIAWPSGMVFDYGTPTVQSIREVVPQILILVAGGATAVVLLLRNRPLGVLLAGFFLLLGPSSSVVPVATQTIAEHRLYLPLGVVLGLGAVLAIKTWRAVFNTYPRRWVSLLAVAVAATALGATTAARNATYRSGLVLWQDTVMKCPNNARAHHNLGLELVRVGRSTEAAGEFRRAIALQPSHAFAHAWLAVLLREQGAVDEAEEHLRAALRADPNYGFAWLQLGHVAVDRLRLDEASAAYATAVRLEPRNAEAHFGLGSVLAQQRQIEAALAEFRTVLALDPAHAEARANLGNCLLVTGRVREAIAAYEEVLRARPDDQSVRRNLELAREHLGR